MIFFWLSAKFIPAQRLATRHAGLQFGEFLFPGREFYAESVLIFKTPDVPPSRTRIKFSFRELCFAMLDIGMQRRLSLCWYQFGLQPILLIQRVFLRFFSRALPEPSPTEGQTAPDHPRPDPSLRRNVKFSYDFRRACLQGHGHHPSSIPSVQFHWRLLFRFGK